jgi:23S rRNA U2552 (ribose-2'-O)-methylase RlmE/FtsJ
MSFLHLPSIHNIDIYKHIKIENLCLLNKALAEQEPSLAEQEPSLAEQEPSLAEPALALAEPALAEPALAEPALAEPALALALALAEPALAEPALALAEPALALAECNDILINKTLYKYLSFIKEQIDCRLEQWDKYKKCTNPYEYIHSLIPNTKQAISTLKPISRSFFKMIEICHSLSLLELLPSACTTFHLAEGPGGFIEAMAYMRKNKDDTYYGMTLIDETNQNVPGWRKSKYFLLNNPNVIIETGIEKNGDLTKPENLRYCYDKYNGKMDLITGDGGFDFSFQYPQQEQISTKLITCQIGFAIAMQKTGGTFILKVYDTFTRFSLDLLFLLDNLYEQVTIIKPNTSRFANSEKYVVCKGFRNSNTLEIVKQFYKILQRPDPINGSFFDFELPCLFTNKIEEFNAIIGQQQIDTIVSTIYLIDNNNKYDKLEHMKKKNIQKCILWCQKHDIPYNNNIQNSNLFISRGAPPRTPYADVRGDVRADADSGYTR